MSQINITQLLAQAAPVTSGNTTAVVPVTAAPELPAGAQQQPSPWGSIALMGALVVFFYLLLIRPQQKKEKSRQKMLRQLAKGDKVVTRGGIWGVVVGLRNEEGLAIVKIADNVKVEVAIQAIDLVNPTAEDAKSNDKKR